jgi:hypothetical protein
MITHVQHELDTIERRQQYKSKRENKVNLLSFYLLFIIIYLDSSR